MHPRILVFVDEERVVEHGEPQIPFIHSRIGRALLKPGAGGSMNRGRNASLRGLLRVDWMIQPSHWSRLPS